MWFPCNNLIGSLNTLHHEGITDIKLNKFDTNVYFMIIIFHSLKILTIKIKY